MPFASLEERKAYAKAYYSKPEQRAKAKAAYIRDREKNLERARRFRIDNLEMMRERGRQRTKNQTPEQKATAKAWVNRNKIRINKMRGERYIREGRGEKRAKELQALKALVMSHYSRGVPRCACCGDDHLEFLCVDHIYGDGKQHRKESGFIGGERLYRWIKRNSFPKGFQILCMNCNYAKGNGRVCPHEKEWRGVVGLPSVGVLFPPPNPALGKNRKYIGDYEANKREVISYESTNA